jgi:Carboxypeptidase regulatory-like domain
LCGGIVAALAVAALVPALAAASSISGTVSAAGGGPIQGVEVCPTPQPYTFETTCVQTGPGGTYTLAGLPGGNYLVKFSGQANNLPYVDEYYDNERYNPDADPFHLGEAENATLDVSLAAGGSIAGTVTDETSGLPIAGIWACAIDQEGIPPRCALSDASGDYVLNGIPSGVFSVEFEGGNRVNYLREFYGDTDVWAQAADITVTAPATSSGIDAELAPGAEILGHVSDPQTGAPSRGVFVCANEAEPGEYQGCDSTDPAGDYAIRSLPAGTYLVAFELEYHPWGLGAKQWWQGAATAAEADPIVLAPPQARTGVDGQATSPFWPQEPVAGGEAAAQPAPVVLPLAAQVQKPLPKCKQGFRRKRVEGKKRCARKHRARQSRRHQKR